MQHSEQARLPESGEKASAKPKKLPDWSGDTVVIMATGASLSADDIDCAHRHAVRTIAVNGAGLTRHLPLAAPWSDILYAADAKWWRYYQPDFGGLKVSGEPVLHAEIAGYQYAAVDTIPLTMLEPDQPMPRTPGKVVGGGHSGFQALGLALSLGASRVLLLGYDCRSIGDKRTAHERPDFFNIGSPFASWATLYNMVPRQWPGVDIINCSVHSAITAFPKAPIAEAL